MGQSNRAGAVSSSSSLPSQQISKRVSTAAPLSIVSALPLPETQKQAAQLLESTADLGSADTIRMAGELYGKNLPGGSNKYTAYGASTY
jgi:hypothetical protein